MSLAIPGRIISPGQALTEKDRGRWGEYLVGSLICPGYGASRNNNKVMTQYTLYAYLIHLARGITVDRIGVQVETADAGKLIRLGIYNNADFLPTTLVKDGGTVSTTSTGDVLATLSPSISLPKGFYWLVSITDSDGTAATTNTAIYPGDGGVLNSPLGMENGEYGYVGRDVAASGTEFANLPDPFPGSTTLRFEMQTVMLRVESND